MDAIAETPAIGPDIERGLALEAVVWTLVGFSAIFMALRIWARTYTRMLSADDMHMAACWLTFAAMGVVATLIAESGGTRHFAYLTLEQKQYQVKLQIVLTTFGIPCTAFGKIAVAFTILRIINQTSTWHFWSLWALIVLTAVTSAIDVLLVLFRCGNPEHLWDLMGQATGAVSCLNTNAVYNYNTFAASFQAFGDFFLALLPAHIIWGLQMRLARKLALMALLGLTTFTGIAAAVKTSIASSHLGVAADLTWDMFPLSMWASVEITLIVICGSVPALVPLWDRFVRQRQRRRKGYYGSATYGVSDYSSSNKPKPGSKQSFSRTMVSTATSIGGGSNTELCPGVITPGTSENRDGADVEMVRLSETQEARGLQ